MLRVHIASTSQEILVPGLLRSPTHSHACPWHSIPSTLLLFLFRVLEIESWFGLLLPSHLAKVMLPRIENNRAIHHKDVSYMFQVLSDQATPIVFVIQLRLLAAHLIDALPSPSPSLFPTPLQSVLPLLGLPLFAG